MDSDNNLTEILTEALDGVIECRNCGNSIEPDCPKCSCGWINPIVANGMI